MKKYVVIDTWNGEGYSTENGVDIKQFDYRKSALKWAYKRALSNAQDDADDVQRYSDQTDLMKANDNGDGYFWETYDDNCGSYQVWETKDVYAFMIQCNVNDVTPLTKKQFIEEIEDKEEVSCWAYYKIRELCLIMFLNIGFFNVIFILFFISLILAI